MGCGRHIGPGTGLGSVERPRTAGPAAACPLRCRPIREDNVTSRDVEIPRAAYGLAGTARRPDDAVAISFRRARLHGGVRVSYLAGGVLGAFLALHWDLWSLTLLLAVLAVLAVLIGLDLGRTGART